MTSDEVNDTYLARAAAMFAKVDGAACVNLDRRSGEVHLCRRLNDLSIDDDQLQGMCDWQDVEEDRPDELTDGLAISCDQLDVGRDWWYDIYFGWYFVFEPELVKRSLEGDHSWVDGFLKTTIRNRTVPRPPPTEDMTHLLPDVEALRYYG